jgi:hypothetical protein
MIELKGKKGRPSLGIYMERLNQRGRWEESSCQDRNSKTLNFSFWICFVFDILDYSSVDSLVSSKMTDAQEVGL